jgi:hypothetical protein
VQGQVAGARRGTLLCAWAPRTSAIAVAQSTDTDGHGRYRVPGSGLSRARAGVSQAAGGRIGVGREGRRWARRTLRLGVVFFCFVSPTVNTLWHVAIQPDGPGRAAMYLVGYPLCLVMGRWILGGIDARERADPAGEGG